MICYTPKMELQMRSYDMMKNANKLWFRGKSTLRISNPDLDPAGTDPEDLRRKWMRRPAFVEEGGKEGVGRRRTCRRTEGARGGGGGRRR